MISNEKLAELVTKNKANYKLGKNADYIPALANVPSDQLGVAYYDLATNTEHYAGDAEVRFAIESMSKVPVLMLAILDNGIDYVFSRINTEPSGFAFNSIMNMEINHHTKPSNPFINAGAIATTSLIKAENAAERFERILAFMKKISNDDGIILNNEIYTSESKTGDMNRSLAYYMKANNIIEGDVDDILEAYFKQCSVEVTARGMARIGALLANGGVAPWNNERMIPEQVATIIKSVMTTAGLYDESGEFSVQVGVPSKSGVGGGIMSAVPKKCGVGLFSPPLDTFGNSTASMSLLKDIVEDQDLDIYK